MGLEAPHKRGADALAALGGNATEPGKRFKVTPRRRAPDSLEPDRGGGEGAKYEGNIKKKVKDFRVNDSLTIWSSRDRAIKAPRREGGWGWGIRNGGGDAAQISPPKEEEDEAAHQGQEGEGGVGGLSEAGLAGFLTARLVVDEEVPKGGGPDNTEGEGAATAGKVQVTKGLANEERPDKAYTTERAKRNGLANASSGRIVVTSPKDHFGPITAAHDPVHQTGVLVGAAWGGRLECRQWGVHLPPVAGIAGQSGRGAQSVVVSGGYEDDEDHGWYFIYTGSGGRDLSGNRRTNKEQSKEQVFEKNNLALKVSCREGYPVRVLRSHKDRRSAFAPRRKVVRYDGIYRVEQCWRTAGKQNALMCRFLFVRCDNEPPPWDSDGAADSPHRNVPEIAELEGARDVFKRVTSPAWDWKEDEGCWGWTREPPPSQHKASKKPRGNQTRTPQIDVVQYDAPSPGDPAPSASARGGPSEADSDDDVSNPPPSARAGRADVTQIREAALAPDFGAPESEPLEDVDAPRGQKPDDVSPGDADDVSVGDDSASVEEAAVGSGAPRAGAFAADVVADVTGLPEQDRAREGAQTDGLLGGIPRSGLETEDTPSGAKSSVKKPAGDMLRVVLTPEGEKVEEVLLGESSVENKSGGVLPAVLTPDSGAEANRASSPLQPCKLQFSDVDAAWEEARVEEPMRRTNGGVREQSGASLPKALTPVSGSSGSDVSGGLGVEPAGRPAKPDDVAADWLGGNREESEESESEEESAEPEHVEDSKELRERRWLRAHVMLSQDAEAALPRRAAQLESTLSHGSLRASEDPPTAVSDDVSVSEGAPAGDVSRAQPPTQPDVSPVSEVAAFRVSRDADGVSASGTGRPGAAPSDVTSLSADVRKASEAESGGRGVLAEGDIGRTSILGRIEEDGPVIRGNSVKSRGAAVLEAGLTPKLLPGNDPAASPSQQQSLRVPDPSFEMRAVVGNGDGVIQGGNGAVPECLTPGGGSKESGASSRKRGVESASLPASPPWKRAKAGDVASVSVRDPSGFLAAVEAEPVEGRVRKRLNANQKANHPTEFPLEGELQTGAALQGPPTPDNFEKARTPVQPLGQPGTRTNVASRPDFRPGAPTDKPGTEVSQLIARGAVPTTLAHELGAAVGERGIGVGPLEAELSPRGSPDGLRGGGELERGEKQPNPDRRELMRVAQEIEARCREIGVESREAKEAARAAEERAREWEETAQGSEERARESKKQAGDSEARTREAEERARKAEERARGPEERARENEARTQESKKQLRESEAKGRGWEERLRVSEGFGRALEAMKRETEERIAAEVHLKKTMEKEREDFWDAVRCLLWGKDVSGGSLAGEPVGKVTARGLVESVGALKELLEDPEGLPGEGTGGLIERAREQLLVLRTDLRRSREEVGMLETMLDQSEQLREGLERSRGDIVETGGGVEKKSQKGTIIAGVEKATQTDGLGDREAGRPLGDVIPDRADVVEMRAELESIKREYRELVGLFERERRNGRQKLG